MSEKKHAAEQQRVLVTLQSLRNSGFCADCVRCGGGETPYQSLLINVLVDHVTEGCARLQQTDRILRLISDSFHPLNRFLLIRQA